jgi:predicted enzyme related to lactoylglutathione lyase
LPGSVGDAKIQEDAMGAKKKAKKKAAPRRAPAKKAKKSAARKVPVRANAVPVRANAIVHWEIQSKMPDRLHKFYAEAFGWKIDASNPMNYGMVSSKGKEGIDGGIGGTQHSGSRVLVYAAVKNILDALARIEGAGGKTIMPRTDVGPVIMALYEDPEGNAMGLIEG